MMQVAGVANCVRLSPWLHGFPLWCTGAHGVHEIPPECDGIAL